MYKEHEKRCIRASTKELTVYVYTYTLPHTHAHIYGLSEGRLQHIRCSSQEQLRGIGWLFVNYHFISSDKNSVKDIYEKILTVNNELEENKKCKKTLCVLFFN